LTRNVGNTMSRFAQMVRVLQSHSSKQVSCRFSSGHPFSIFHWLEVSQNRGISSTPPCFLLAFIVWLANSDPNLHTALSDSRSGRTRKSTLLPFVISTGDSLLQDCASGKKLGTGHIFVFCSFPDRKVGNVFRLLTVKKLSFRANNALRNYLRGLKRPECEHHGLPQRNRDLPRSIRQNNLCCSTSDVEQFLDEKIIERAVRICS